MVDSDAVKAIIKQYLKENLSIELNKDIDGDLVVKLRLCEEEISQSWETLPRIRYE